MAKDPTRIMPSRIPGFSAHSTPSFSSKPLSRFSILSPRGGRRFLDRLDRQRFLPVLTLAFCLSLAWAVAPGACAQTPVAPTVGDGLTLDTAYQIAELGNLVWLGERAAANETAGKYYRLLNDLDASDTMNWNDAATTTDTLEGFRPIGTYSSPDTTSFRGFFDGNGKKISGLTIKRSATGYVGLFGYLGTGGEIQNLTLAEGTVSGAARVGALAGANNGWVISCSSNVTVVGTGLYVGGLVGANALGGRVTNGMTFGPVTASGEVGGVVGANSASTLENCFATGNVTATGTYAGGVLGSNSGTVSGCYATGCVTGLDGIGGLLGYSHTSAATKILNSFATGPVTGRDKIGGLVGTTGGTITNCFATGAVTATGTGKGGLVGANTGTITAGYWDRMTTGQTASPGSTASFGKTTAEMKRQATFQPGGGTGATDWDFTTLWGIAEGQSYPYLLSAPPPFRLSVAYDGPGAVSPNPSGTPISVPGTHVIYPAGTTVTLTAAPAARYRFTHWTGPVADPTAASTTVLMDTHKSVMAHFELNEYQLTINAPNGSVTKSPDQAVYAYGTVVALTATPDPRYRFIGWTGPVADPTTLSTTVRMDEARSVTARFELNEYTVAVEATNGAVAKSPDQTTYTYGTEVSLTATPDAGYRFTGWTGNVADPTAASTSLVVTGDTTVTAHFLRSYEIRTLAELQAIATGDLKGYYTLMNDIDASETATWNDAGTTTDTLEGFQPIGDYSYSSPDTVSFQGVFDGNGKKITGLTINRLGGYYIGLFSAVGAGGIIRDLTLERAAVTGGLSVGGLIGYNTEGSIIRCDVSGTVMANKGDGGGLVGINLKGSIADCSVSGRVTGTVSYSRNAIGGLAGINNAGSIVNCYATGTVEGMGTYDINIGGLVGINKGAIQTCFSMGSVTGNSSSNSYNLYVGGLVGSHNGGTLADSFATGAVSGTGKYYPPNMGGLVGRVAGGTVAHCFSVGPMPDKGSYIGGLIGRVSGGTVTASYWDIETSGQIASAGGAGVVGKISGAMKQQATFQPQGGTGDKDWDFESVWGIVEGQTYPYLRSTSQPPMLYLNVSVTGAGSVTLDPPGGVYAPGTTVTLTATAEAGFHLAEWTGTVADRDAEVTTILLDTHKNVTARFLPCYEIRTLEELQAVATGDLTGYYILMNDIDASPTATWNDAGTSETDLLEGFRPIGTYYSTPPDTTSFRGIFEGNGKKITGLTINRPMAYYVGLFGLVREGGEIRNLTLEGGQVTGNRNVGGLIGVNSTWSRVSGCVSRIKVTGNTYVGGLVGVNSGTIVNSVASGLVTDLIFDAPVGGLIGENSGGTVSHCSSTGQIKSGGYAGGLVGRNRYRGTISDCFASGSVIGGYAGGLVGVNGEYNGGAPDPSVIRNCFATGSVTGIEASVGTGVRAGGLVGITNAGSIENCFAIGSVTGQGYMTRLGGLVGSNWGGSITNSFAAGEVTRASSTDSVGGLIGFHSEMSASNTPATLTGCYWDVETSGQTISAGGTGVVGKTTTEMKRQATFQPDGGTGATDWDFTSVWGIVEGLSYPYLGPSSAPPSFRLNVSIEGKGSVAMDPPGGVYAAGTQVTLTAVPNADSRFAEWTGSVTDRAAVSTTVMMDTHKGVTARFLRLYEIRTLDELQAIAGGDLEGYYTLMNDIEAADTANWNDAGTTTNSLEGFRPIGTSSTPFRGVLDGNGKKISGLTINRSINYVGLLGKMDLSGRVENLTLAGGSVRGSSAIAPLVGENNGTVANCSVSLSARGIMSVGGIVGINRGAVTHCSATGSVYLRPTSDKLYSPPHGGGLVGYNLGQVETCFAAGAVTAEAGTTSTATIGGLVGYNSHYYNGKIRNSFATGPVSGTQQTVGGLIGQNFGDLADCLASGPVTSAGPAGGLIGDNCEGSVLHCYATGRVTSLGEAVNAGGLIGRNTGTSVTACYWDVETTSQTTSAGGGVGKTTAEMKQRATFQPGGGMGATDWDFTSVWGIVEGETYPFLRFAPPSFGLNITVEGEGSVALNPAGGTYPWGSVVTLTARPGAGSRFVRWTGDVPSGGAGQNPLQVTIRKDTSITVRFEAGPHPAVWMVR